MASLHNIDGELPETLENIKAVTESQDAVMSFYYTDSSNQVTCQITDQDCDVFFLFQVKVMEIFDVTQTDPSMLVTDSMGIQYSQDDQVASCLCCFYSFFQSPCSRNPSPTPPAAGAAARQSDQTASLLWTVQPQLQVQT